MHSKVKRRKLGDTGLYISELSFGAMNFRLQDNIDQAYELVNFVLDNGINLIDTARGYNGENYRGQIVESEVIVGKSIAARTDLDEPVVVVTKGHGYTPDQLDNELFKSIEKLGITGKGSLKIGGNSIKLVYFFHGISTERWKTIFQSGVLDKIRNLKSEGIINYTGFSSHYSFPDEIKSAIDSQVFDVVELPYNIYNRSLGEDGKTDLLKYAFEKGLGVINMKAFGGNSMPDISRLVKDLIDIDYSDMLNYCLANPYISTVDSGARNVSEFEYDMKTALGKRPCPEELERLRQEADKISGCFKNVCRECLHCMEKFKCSEDIDFPGILSTYARYQIALKVGKDTSPYINKYKSFKFNAQNCLKCGKCLPWCDYRLNIPELLEQAHKALAQSRQH